jgi:glycosyltransferase involved in cell wall biosynthesis
MKSNAKKHPAKLSVVICVYNEELNVRPLVKMIYDALYEYDFEIIFVDDGSTDGTTREIKSLDKKEITIIELRKNYGQSSALSAGIEYARGDYIVTMDGDLQNDPSDIPAMLDKLLEEDLDMVAGVRKNRQDGALLRKIPSQIANKLIRLCTKVNLTDYGCTLKIFRQEIAKDIGIYGELHRFIPVLASLEGGRLGEMEVKHHARRFGWSKYGIGRTTKVLSDLLLMIFLIKYLQKPMHFFGTTGLVVLTAGAAINFYLLVVRLMGYGIWGRPLLILGVIFLLVGFQLITIGIIAELLMRIYYESQQKKPFKIRKITTGEAKGDYIGVPGEYDPLAPDSTVSEIKAADARFG